MREALLHKTLDNITVVMISFKNLKDSVSGKKGPIQSERKGFLLLFFSFRVRNKKVNFLLLDKEIIEYEYTHEKINDGKEDNRLEHKITKLIKKREGN